MALFAGCAATLNKPEVSVAGVEVVEFGVAEQTLLLKLRVVNPNDVDLEIKALTFKLEVNDRALASGESTSGLRLTPRAEATFEIRTLTRLAEIVRVLRSARRSDAPIAYRLHGAVEVDGYGRLPFERSAELPNSAFARFFSH